VPVRGPIGPFVAVLLLAGCAADAGPSRYLAAPGPVERVDPAAEFSTLRFGSEGESLNDRCPVREAPLNPKMPPVFVNGRPVGFC